MSAASEPTLDETVEDTADPKSKRGKAAAKPAPERLPDADVVLPEPTPLVVSGIECKIRRLKTRELLLFMRVLSNGFGPGLINARLNFNDQDELVSQILAILVVSIPNAVEEFLVFVRNVVAPVDGKKQRDLALELDNPELDVLLDVAERVVLAEKDDIMSLAGKAQAMWSRMQGAFQTGSPSRGGNGRSPDSST